MNEAPTPLEILIRIRSLQRLTTQGFFHRDKPNTLLHNFKGIQPNHNIGPLGTDSDSIITLENNSSHLIVTWRGSLFRLWHDRRGVLQAAHVLKRRYERAVQDS